MKWLIAVIFPFISLTGCKTTSKSAIDNILSAQRAVMLPDSLLSKQKNGVDLYATGDLPVYWWIEIDFDKKIIFKATDGDEFNVLPAFTKKDTTADARIYQLRTEGGQASIKIYNTDCSATSSTKKVQVSIGNKLYVGCGQYLYDHRINDIWQLDMINNIQQSASAFSTGLPTLQFDLQKNSVNGSDGCNEISSKIELQGSRIRFDVFSSSKRSCNNNKVEKIYHEMLSGKLVDYYEENGRLVFYLIDDSKLIFKRKIL
ncbi:MAG: META domain-containing protein [Ferruginibacter sp.]